MVMPVESGERKTIALFMEGPLFKWYIKNTKIF
jgi:hypothetical protein